MDTRDQAVAAIRRAYVEGLRAGIRLQVNADHRAGFEVAARRLDPSVIERLWVCSDARLAAMEQMR